MKVIFRIFIDGELTVEEVHDTQQVNLADLQRQHEDKIQKASDKPWMIEIEIVDAPDDRFLRFGTDTRRMSDPIELGRLHEHAWAQGNPADHRA